MPSLPLTKNDQPGVYQVCTNANVDYPIVIPPRAVKLWLWFEASATDNTVVGGRVGFNQVGTPMAGLTGTDSILGYHPPLVVLYELPFERYDRETRMTVRSETHLHVACDKAGAILKGSWLFG